VGTNRKQILDNIKTTLTGIVATVVPASPRAGIPAPTQAYETTVQVVDQFIRMWDEVPTTSPPRPKIGIVPGQESFVYHATYEQFVTIRIYLWIHITGATNEAMRTLMDQVYDDIFYALNIDTRRGGYANKTTFLATETDELDVERANSMTMRIDLDIEYTRTVAKN
jgi:hypothetical protein